jgi:hypothetical protein
MRDVMVVTEQPHAPLAEGEKGHTAIIIQ